MSIRHTAHCASAMSPAACKPGSNTSAASTTRGACLASNTLAPTARSPPPLKRRHPSQLPNTESNSLHRTCHRWNERLPPQAPPSLAMLRWATLRNSDGCAHSFSRWQTCKHCKHYKLKWNRCALSVHARDRPHKLDAGGVCPGSCAPPGAKPRPKPTPLWPIVQPRRVHRGVQHACRCGAAATA